MKFARSLLLKTPLAPPGAGARVQPAERRTDRSEDDTGSVDLARILNSRRNATPPVILVVDDDELQRSILRELLAAANYRLIFAAGGSEALSILAHTKPDLILMDIVMPDLDGIETTRRLKTLPRCADVPVIMMTGKGDTNAVRDSMKAGATHFLLKPLDRRTLLTKIAHTLGGSLFINAAFATERLSNPARSEFWPAVAQT